jgi:hypothetical protein
MRTVPEPMRKYYLQHYRICIEAGHKICAACRNKWTKTAESDTRYLALKELEDRDIKSGNVPSNAYDIWRLNYNEKKDDLIKQLKQQKKDCEALLKWYYTLNLGVNKKWKRRKPPKFRTHEDFMKYVTKQRKQRGDILQMLGDEKTNRYINHIKLDMLSPRDCKQFTGFTWKELEKQMLITGLTLYEIFHLRVRIYSYFAWETQALLFGESRSNLQKMWEKNLDIMNEKYAKPYLLNSGAEKDQYWTRKRIRDNTPDFCYQLRKIDKATSDIILINQDSTYQYSQAPHGDIGQFKSTTSGYKKGAHVLKIHIWSCPN